MARRTALIISTLTITAWPVVGSAQEGDEARRARLSDAMRLLENMNYRAADRELRSVVEAGGLTPDQLSDAYRGIAECAAALRQRDDAYQAFLRLLVVDSTYELSETASPLVREPYDAAVEYWQGARRPSVRFDPRSHVEHGQRVVITPEIERGPLESMVARVTMFAGQPRTGYAPHEAVDDRFELEAEELAGLDEIGVYFEVSDEHDNVVIRLGSPEEPIPVSLVQEAIGPNPYAVPARTRRPVFREWWFWTALGVAVAVLGLAIGLPVGLANARDDDACSAAIGSACEYEATLSPRE